MKHMQFFVGVDEAGRGALAGPVGVGVVLTPHDFDFARIPEVRDSKQLSAKARERVYALARQLKKEKVLDFKVAMVEAKVIDKIGITRVTALAVARALARLEHSPLEVEVRLDGLLHAPMEYTHQQTIIRGDQTEPIISLASIIAKVTRDRLMVRLAKQYPVYGFEQHKGYGTLLHRQRIKEHGLCDLHRKYFCRKLCSGV